MLLGASAGIKHLCTQSGHLSPFHTSLNGVTAPVLVFQSGNPFSRCRRDGNNGPDFRKSIIYPLLFPLTALLVLPVPVHQREAPMGCLCYVRDAQDQTSQVSKDRSSFLRNRAGGDGGFPSNGCIHWGQILTGICLCVCKGVKLKTKPAGSGLVEFCE